LYEGLGGVAPGAPFLPANLVGEVTLKTQRSADLACGCLLVLLGIVVLVAASQIRGGMEERLPPRTLPYIVGVTILSGGAFLALKSWRRGGKDVPLKWPDRGAMIRITVILLAAVVFVLVMTPIGFPLSSGLYIAFSIWYLKRSAVWTGLICGIITGVLSYYVFGQLLELSLPIGTIFFE
jgi:putative tricarboxylic transport membrane protein